MTRLWKVFMGAIGFFVAVCLIVMATYAAAFAEFRDGMFDPLMELAQELCTHRGGALVAIPMAKGGTAVCLTTDEANERGIHPDASGIYGQIVMPEARDFGDIVMPDQ